MTLEQALRLTNRNMIAFDLVLGSAAIAAPEATLRVLGHDEPSPDAAHLFRRCGPIWLTFAAAHALAAARGERRDWWALAWLRGTEIATDALWSGVARREPARRQARPAPRRRRQPGDGRRLRLALEAMSESGGQPSKRWSLRGRDEEGNEVWLIRSFGQKLYRCPGCHGDIEIGTEHTVVQYVLAARRHRTPPLAPALRRRNADSRPERPEAGARLGILALEAGGARAPEARPARRADRPTRRKQR